jgi:hypothetical protein
MSESVIYEVQPKEVDADGNEVTLANYTVQSTSATRIKNELALASTTGGVYTSLTSTTGHTLAQLQSDQPINLDIQSSTGGSLLIITAIKNFMFSNTSGKTYTYKILNASGSTANIVWRLYV